MATRHVTSTPSPTPTPTPISLCYLHFKPNVYTSFSSRYLPGKRPTHFSSPKSKKLQHKKKTISKVAKQHPSGASAGAFLYHYFSSCTTLMYYGDVLWISGSVPGVCLSGGGGGGGGMVAEGPVTGLVAPVREQTRVQYQTLRRRAVGEPEKNGAWGMPGMSLFLARLISISD